MYFDALAKQYKFKLSTPVKDLPPEVLDVILYGTKGEKLKLTTSGRTARVALTAGL